MTSPDSENVHQWFEQIKSKHQQPENPSSTVSSKTDDWLNQLKNTYQSQKSNPSEAEFQQNLEAIKESQKRQRHQNNSYASSPTDHRLEQLKDTYQTQKSTTPDVSLQENVEQIRIQEQRQQLRQKQLLSQAQKWLDQLSPYSDEGFWFEQFAQTYPSRLEAAIAYLDFLEKG